MCLFIVLILIPLKSKETWLLILEAAGIKPFPKQLHSVTAELLLWRVRSSISRATSWWQRNHSNTQSGLRNNALVKYYMSQKYHSWQGYIQECQDTLAGIQTEIQAKTLEIWREKKIGLGSHWTSLKKMDSQNPPLLERAQAPKPL